MIARRRAAGEVLKDRILPPSKAKFQSQSHQSRMHDPEPWRQRRRWQINDDRLLSETTADVVKTQFLTFRRTADGKRSVFGVFGGVGGFGMFWGFGFLGVFGGLGILGCFGTFGCLGVWGVLGFRIFGGFGCWEVLWCSGVLGCLGVTVKRLRV